MSVITNSLSLIRLGMIDIRLMFLTMDLKRSKRTYLSYSTLFSLANNYQHLLRRNTRPLQVAEFGVGRGGSAILLAWLVNRGKGKIILYDVFSRIPAPTEQDGERAVNRYKVIINHEGEDYYGNIKNLLEVILFDLHKVCHRDRIEIVQGKYEETLPKLNDNKAFDLVHIDCDWYEGSKTVYNYLRTRLNPGAFIQVDDYSNWDGSSRAFQDATWLSTYQTHLIDGALVIDTSKYSKT
jgi:hypothetical protein